MREWPMIDTNWSHRLPENNNIINLAEYVKIGTFDGKDFYGFSTAWCAFFAMSRVDVQELMPHVPERITWCWTWKQRGK